MNRRELTQSQPKIEEKEPDAIEIQGKNTKIKPKKKQETPSKEKPLPAPEEETNQVAFGEGGRSAVLTEPSLRAAPRADSESLAAAEISGQSTPGMCT